MTNTKENEQLLNRDTENTDYSYRYVAFIDIWGFKNLVYSSENDSLIKNKLYMAMKYITQMKNQNYTDEYPLCELGKEVSVFSDSIVISYDGSVRGGCFNVLLDCKCLILYIP